jgi:hypothetical protein
MVCGFVKQSGGAVRIETAPGQGTTVHLYLPRTSLPVLSEATNSASVAFSRRSPARDANSRMSSPSN